MTAIGSQAILRLPQAASSKLPSRGMSMVEGTFNGRAFQAPLEPDGIGSHWFRISNTMLRASGAQVGDSVSVAVEPMALWPEPKVPADLAEAFASDPEARRLWMDITPLARWDWIRWIGSTRNRDTRAIRIEKTLSVPGDTKLVEVEITRLPSLKFANKITGDAWIDDISLNRIK